MFDKKSLIPDIIIMLIPLASSFLLMYDTYRLGNMIGFGLSVFSAFLILIMIFILIKIREI